MAVDVKKYNQFLENFSGALDIPPNKYKEAVDRYETLGKFLEGGKYPGCGGELQIYVQGSFLLGTVTRPIKKGKDADYDIDLVCELPAVKSTIDPKTIKSMVGERLRESEHYAVMMDKEGRRCWTLIYAEQDGIGFHLDILPCIPEQATEISVLSNFGVEEDLSRLAIAITQKENDDSYTWSSSNPRGYGEWFGRKNRAMFLMLENVQKAALAKNNTSIFASIDDVPDQLVKTPLQQSIQIMKRHRDHRFNGHIQSDYKPISMIITTLAAHLYQNESDVYSALKNIVEKLHAHASLIENKYQLNESLAALQLIMRGENGTWYIGNPVNPAENFADRWHEDNHARARAFFTWVEWLKQDLVDILVDVDERGIRRALSSVFGALLVEEATDGVFAQPIDAPTVITPRRVTIEESPAKPWRSKK